MNEILLELSIAYVFLTALVLLSLVYSRWHWSLKAGLILVALVFYWASYQGWKESQGWPTATQLPDKFLLHFTVIEEPDDEIGLEGQIFIWLTDLSAHEVAAEPRAYRLPYEKILHSKLDAAMRESGSGKLQIGQINPVEDMQQSEQTALMGHKYPGLKFDRLPDPALPEK